MGIYIQLDYVSRTSGTGEHIVLLCLTTDGQGSLEESLQIYVKGRDCPHRGNNAPSLGNIEEPPVPFSSTLHMLYYYPSSMLDSLLLPSQLELLCIMIDITEGSLLHVWTIWGHKRSWNLRHRKHRLRKLKWRRNRSVSLSLPRSSNGLYPPMGHHQDDLEPHQVQTSQMPRGTPNMKFSCVSKTTLVLGSTLNPIQPFQV